MAENRGRPTPENPSTATPLDDEEAPGASELRSKRDSAPSASLEELRPAAATSSCPPGAHAYTSWLDGLRDANPPLAPFHWDVEFPEVFLPGERENPGFDGIVGNPPFAGHTATVTANRPMYTEWLRHLHADSAGKCDLVAHFFRRAFILIRQSGAFGLIATNTIGQGDTRASGLRFICEHGGEIYCARRRVPWPGLAAVIVSIVHIHRGAWNGTRLLERAPQPKITAFLFHRGGHNAPQRLGVNAHKSFQGSIVLGMGFTFDDTDKKGVTTPIAEMRQLIDNDPRNQETIRPYIGGAEVNTSPTHAHHRWVIDFRDYPLRRKAMPETWHAASREQKEAWRRAGVVPLDYPEPVAADWPDLLDIVERKVRPERLASAARSKSSHARRCGVWWQRYHQAKELYAALANLERVLAISGVGQHAAIAFLPADMVFAHSLMVFPLPTHSAFCALQSRPHELWARFFGSSMKDDLRYTPSDCFETFPLPAHWETHPDLEAAGKTYYDHRATQMIENDEGLTKTYNRFHDPHETSPAILKLRDLHAAMDRAVLDAYGWTDVPTDCEFLLDYEIDEETWGSKKKPYRCRWPNEVRDEVLARLLELNARRADEEKRASPA